MKDKRLKSLKLESENFYLRILKMSDLNKKYLSWLNDKEITQYLENPKEKYTKKDLLNYYKQKNYKKKLIFAIIDKKNNKHVGNVGLNPIDEKNKKTGLGGLIGDKKYWGSSAFTESMVLLINYSFKVRKFIKIESGVYENNAPCIIASKKVGFKLEGIRKKNAIIYGKPCDTYLFGITNKKNEKYI